MLYSLDWGRMCSNAYGVYVHSYNNSWLFFFYQANISTKGSYQEIQASGFDFAKLLGSLKAKSNEPNNDVLNRNHKIFNSISTPGSGQINLSKIVEMKQNGALTEPNGKTKLRSSVHALNRLYISYFSATGSIWNIILFLFMFIFTQVLMTGGDYWLNFW